MQTNLPQTIVLRGTGLAAPSTALLSTAPIVIPAADPDTQEQRAYEVGKEDARNGQNRNPFPEGSILSRDWRVGHCEVACDECNATRTQLRCPRCHSDEIETWEYEFHSDPETGFCDSGVRARCLDAKCRMTADIEEFQVPCEHCNGTGVEPPQPNWLGQAFQIAQGRIPASREERARIVAVIEHCRGLASAALMMPEGKEVA